MIPNKNNLRIKFPEQSFGKISKRPEEFLLLCFYDPFSISTVPEVIASIQSESCFSITVLNMFEHRQDSGYLKLSPYLNIDRFSGIIIHNSVSYNVDNLRSLDTLTKRKFKEFEGIKVIFKQDENYRFRELADYIGEVRFDIVFTCLPESNINQIYPTDKVGRPRMVRMLTGYVTPTLRAISPNIKTRPIDIGYRGSIQPLSFGLLAFEKRKIGEDIARLLTGRNLSIDISSRWEDRLGGESWFEFLRSCKATLGTESGASIFDLPGDLEARCRRIEKKLGPFQQGNDYAVAYLSELSDLEDNIHYHQVSPRHLEAAATGTLQLLYPGTYSGIFESQKHYFPLERNYSNLEEALELVLDDARRKQITQVAYEEIIQNKKWWIESFVELLDGQLFAAIREKGKYQRSVTKAYSKAHNILLIAAHEPSLDPRIGWIEHGAAGSIKIHQLGVLPQQNDRIINEFSTRGALIVAYPRMRCTKGFLQRWYSIVGMNPTGMVGLLELLFLENLLTLSQDRFCETLCVPIGCERIGQFQWYLNYVLDTSFTLLTAVERMKGIHAIIATDLDTLPVGLILKGALSVPLFYDAHEYWPEADPSSFEFEKQFWLGMERRLVKHTDYRQTVSPGLAGIMSKQYGCDFNVTPNAAPITSATPTFSDRKKDSAKCHFLYQGGFATGRGIDLLIEAWPKTIEQAILILRGPDNPYKIEMMELANRTGLLGKRIFFPDAVAESQLISAAGDSDVGLIPYSPLGANYKHCCPNKLSQYMAAGLPILANRTSFVDDIVQRGNCGKIIDFSQTARLISVIDNLTNDSIERSIMAKNSYQYFLKEFNWKAISKTFYSALECHIQYCSPELIELFELNSKPYIMNYRNKNTSITSGHPNSLKRRSMIYKAMQSCWHLLPDRLRIRLVPLAYKIFKYYSFH